VLETFAAVRVGLSPAGHTTPAAESTNSSRGGLIRRLGFNRNPLTWMICNRPSGFGASHR